MAVELASAYVSIIPSAKGIKSSLASELRPLEDEGTRVGERTGRNFGRTFTASVGAAATRGALLLAGGLTLAGVAGIKVAADFEQTQIAFEGLLGGAEQAKSVLDELRDFAAHTPFEFTGLTDAAKTLLGVGFAAEDIIPTMSTLGNVAATLGVGEEGIRGVVRALGQIKGKGKVSAEELQQISEQIPGFSAIESIAKGLGVTVPEAFDQISKGLVPADQGIQAILAGMESFPGAAGAMERQSKTLNGVISTFKDTLATTAIDFITPYLPAISSGVAAFGGFISETLVPGVQSLIDLFQEEGLKGVLGDLGGQLGSLIETQGPVVLQALGVLVGDVAHWAATDGLDRLGEGIRVLVPALVSWISRDAIPGLLAELPGFLEALDNWIAHDLVPGVFGLGVDVGAALIDGIGEALGAAASGASGFGADLVNGVIDFLNASVIDRINDLLEIHIDVPLGPDIDIDPPDINHIPHLASGGPLAAGQLSVVGEDGPELFVPRRAGVVLPHGAALAVAGASHSGPLVGSLTVIEREGENSVTTAMRELNWHRQIQMAVSSR